MKHLKHFETTAQYEAFKGSSGFLLPNVSYTKDGNLYYNSYVVPQGTPCQITFINAYEDFEPQQVTVDVLEGITWLDFANSDANLTFEYNDSEYQTFTAHDSYIEFQVLVPEQDWVYNYMLTYDGTEDNCVKPNDIIDSSTTYYIKMYD